MFCVVETISENAANIPEVFKVPQSWLFSKNKKVYVMYPVAKKVGVPGLYESLVTKCIGRNANISEISAKFRLQEYSCKILKKNLGNMQRISHFKHFDNHPNLKKKQ